MTQDPDSLETQLRRERIKAQSAARDAEKTRKAAATERESIVQVLNDLFVEYTLLKQTTDREAMEAREAIRQRDETIANYQIQLRDVTAMLDGVRHSISFRVMVTLGRPIAMIRSRLSSGKPD
jgi:hypothetical protein